MTTRIGRRSCGRPSARRPRRACARDLRGVGARARPRCPSPRLRAAASRAACGSSWRSISRSIRCSTVDARAAPWRGRTRPRARAGRRRSPRRVARAARCQMAATSSRSRNVMTPGRSMPGIGEPDRLRAGGEHELASTASVSPSASAPCARFDIDRGRAAAIAQRDAAVAPPASRLQLDVRRRDLAGQHRRQQHAVVGGRGSSPTTAIA